jgi:hypothetical protein
METVAAIVAPGSLLPPQVGTVEAGLQPLTGYVIFILGFPTIDTSPVFFNTTVNTPPPVAFKSLIWSITAVGLLPAMPARLKKTPEITTAAATVIAISRITATKGLKPTDVFLLISTTSLHFLYL